MFKKVLITSTISLLAACGNNDNDSESQQSLTDLGQRQTSEAFSLRVLHMNDHHSHLESDTFDLDVSELALDTRDSNGDPLTEVEVEFGGFPMLTTLFQTLEQNRSTDGVLKLHSGDAITGTLFYTLYGGRADADMMNQICFDAFAIGNHEFDSGDAGLVSFLDDLNSSACNTPALAANIIPGNNSPLANDYIKPYEIFNIQGEKVGIIGIDIAQKTKQSSYPDTDTEFLPELQTAQENIDILTGMGINKIILMTHYQYTNDIDLASKLSGVDVIVGGDSHTLLGDESFTDFGFGVAGPYPTVIKNTDGHDVCIVQAWEYAQVVGSLDVTFDENGIVTSCAGNNIMPISNQFKYGEDIDGNDLFLSGNDVSTVQALFSSHDEYAVTYPDATSESILEIYTSDIETLKQQVVGTADVLMCLERVPGQQKSGLTECHDATYERGSDISNYVAKAFLKVSKTADIAIQNGGGVRTDLAAGDITIANAFELLPFSNTLVILEMTGAQIKTVLEEAITTAIDPDGSTGAYPYAAGLRYDVNLQSGAGNRVTNLEVNSQVAGQWVTLDNQQNYRVVTNDFIAKGRDGYNTFGEIFNAGNFEDTFTEYAQGLIDFIEQEQQAGNRVNKLPLDEYSTQSFTNQAGCNHSDNNNC